MSDRPIRGLAVFIALCAVFFVAGCGGGSGSSSGYQPAKIGPDSPMRAMPMFNPRAGGHFDPDAYAKGGQDANTDLVPLGDGKYKLIIQNTSSLGYLDTYNWVPPSGLTPTQVVSQTIGKCDVENGPVGPSKTIVPQIACDASIPPPKCTCGPYNQIEIVFKATYPKLAGPHGFVFGTLLIGDVTLVPWQIPGYVNAPSPSDTFADFPRCKAGQTSTKENPCAQ